MEAVTLGVPMLVNRYGLDSKIMAHLKSESVYSNSIELAEKILKDVIVESEFLD
jgi:hypothetical protein